MGKHSANEPGEKLAQHNLFEDEYETSREFLDLIQEQNYETIKQSGFFVHFLDAVRDLDDFPPDARVVVQQTSGDIRMIWAMLRHPDPTGKQSPVVQVGEVFAGVRHAIPPFDAADLDLAINQLDGLQQMKILGALSIDNSLSYTDFRSTHMH
jgi:hypothetical protein